MSSVPPINRLNWDSSDLSSSNNLDTNYNLVEQVNSTWIMDDLCQNQTPPSDFNLRAFINAVINIGTELKNLTGGQPPSSSNPCALALYNLILKNNSPIPPKSLLDSFTSTPPSQLVSWLTNSDGNGPETMKELQQVLSSGTWAHTASWNKNQNNSLVQNDITGLQNAISTYQNNPSASAAIALAQAIHKLTVDLNPITDGNLTIINTFLNTLSTDPGANAQSFTSLTNAVLANPSSTGAAVQALEKFLTPSHLSDLSNLLSESFNEEY